MKVAKNDIEDDGVWKAILNLLCTVFLSLKAVYWCDSISLHGQNLLHCQTMWQFSVQVTRTFNDTDLFGSLSWVNVPD